MAMSCETRCAERPPLWCMERRWPAAHSMDTEWFAVDADGHVAVFQTGENGPMPEVCLEYDWDWYRTDHVMEHATFHDFWGVTPGEELPALLTSNYTACQTGAYQFPSLQGLRDAFSMLREQTDGWPPPMIPFVVLHLRDASALQFLCEVNREDRELRGYAHLQYQQTHYLPAIYDERDDSEVVIQSAGIVARLQDQRVLVYTEALLGRTLLRLHSRGDVLGATVLSVPATCLDLRHAYRYEHGWDTTYHQEAAPSEALLHVDAFPPAFVEQLKSFEYPGRFRTTDILDLNRLNVRLRWWR